MSIRIDNKKRILDRSSYPPRTISTFGVIGAYIVDIYYNHLYAEAIKMKNSGRVSSITEGYKHAVAAFMSAIDQESKTYKPKNYTQLLTGINEYFTVWTSFSTLTLNDCIDKITREFIPEDYYESVDKDKKRNVLRLILVNSIKGFSIAVIQEFLGSIIDNHDEPANIDAMKDKITDLLIMEREALYQRFLMSSAGKNVETVDKNLAVRMQQEIKKLGKENTTLIKELEESKKMLNLRNDQLSELLERYKVLLRKYKGSKEEYASLQARLNVPDESEYLKDDDYEDKQVVVNTSSMQNNNFTPTYNTPTLVDKKSTTPVAKTPSKRKTTQKTIPIEDSSSLPAPPKSKAKKKTTPTNQDMQELLNKHTKKTNMENNVNSNNVNSNNNNTNNTKQLDIEEDIIVELNDQDDQDDDNYNQDNSNKESDELDDTKILEERRLEQKLKSTKKSIESIKRVNMGDEPSISDIY